MNSGHRFPPEVCGSPTPTQVCFHISAVRISRVEEAEIASRPGRPVATPVGLRCPRTRRPPPRGPRGDAGCWRLHKWSSRRDDVRSDRWPSHACHSHSINSYLGDLSFVLDAVLGTGDAAVTKQRRRHPAEVCDSLGNTETFPLRATGTFLLLREVLKTGISEVLEVHCYQPLYSAPAVSSSS